MSDTDDGFDEEAVRRELREKYENDDREETERMSELLLKGATMTNQHCDNCGTPIFRYDGQSFCPNCQHEYEQAQGRTDQHDQPQQHAGGQQPQSQPQTGSQRGDEQPASGQTADRSQAPAVDAETTTTDATEPAPDDTTPAAGDTTPAAENAAGAGETAPSETGHAAADAGRRQLPSQADRTGGNASDRNPRSRDTAQRPTQARQGGQSNATPAVSGEGADALESSIAALARRAAGSDDPRRAREYLEAAREAAEALAALHRNE